VLTFGDCAMSVVELEERVRFICGIRLPSMDRFSIIDTNKRMCCAETQNNYCFKYLAVFSIRKPNFVNVTDR